MMELEEETNSVLTNTPSSINVSLHPLVVLNISDHFTRARMQREDATSPSGWLYLNRAHRTIDSCTKQNSLSLENYLNLPLVIGHTCKK